MNEKIDKQALTITYTCPMHPEVRQEGPGKCPKCGMSLTPESGAHAHAHDHSGATGEAGGCCGGKGHGGGGGCCGGKGHD